MRKRKIPMRQLKEQGLTVEPVRDLHNKHRIKACLVRKFASLKVWSRTIFLLINLKVRLALT